MNPFFRKVVAEASKYMKSQLKMLLLTYQALCVIPVLINMYYKGFWVVNPLIACTKKRD